MMTEENLDIFATRELFLAEGVTSPEVVVEDENDTNLYLAFRLRYIPDNQPGGTSWSMTDDQHVVFTIETRPNSVTRPGTLIELGELEDGTPIFMGFVVQAEIPQTGQHQVNVTLYSKKPDNHGGKAE